MAIGNAQQPRDYEGTPNIPIYVMLPLSTISSENKVAEPEKLKFGLDTLKAAGTDGVMVDCWWGIVEGKGPGQYDWSGYQELFNLVRQANLKLQVVMSFHQCGGNVGDDVFIPLPQWVLDVGMENPDIFFTNQAGTRNPESLSFGVDYERVLAGRTGLEVFYYFMHSFKKELGEFIDDGTITEVEVGLGPCGELRYPSYPETQGWKYPGTGEFQCYDKYLLANLESAAEDIGRPEWGVPPSNAGHYNTRPHESEFFRDNGVHSTAYGQFFLTWYSQALIEHGDSVLYVARLALGDIKLAAKVSGIHWWYKTSSHAAELTAGFYNLDPVVRCGYSPIASMFASHDATFNFTCVELRTEEQHQVFPEAQTDPESLVMQVLNAAWDAGADVACENALTCYHKSGYDQILASAKPEGIRGKHLVAFTYLRLTRELLEEQNLREFTDFVSRLHGNKSRECVTFGVEDEAVLEESTQLSDVPVPEKCTVSEVELFLEESILFDELLSEDCTDSEELVSEECTDSESDEDSQTVSEPDSESEEDSKTVSEPDSEAEVPNTEDLLSWVEEAVRSGFEDTAEGYTCLEADDINQRAVAVY